LESPAATPFDPNSDRFFTANRFITTTAHRAAFYSAKRRKPSTLKAFYKPFPQITDVKSYTGSGFGALCDKYPPATGKPLFYKNIFGNTSIKTQIKPDTPNLYGRDAVDS
jgi:hypothetical protein